MESNLKALIETKLMQRHIEQWQNCVPSAMVNMSPAAIQYAFQDAKSDILALYKENQKLKAAMKDEYGSGYDAGYAVGCTEEYDKGYSDGIEAGYNHCRDGV